MGEKEGGGWQHTFRVGPSGALRVQRQRRQGHSGGWENGAVAAGRRRRGDGRKGERKKMK